MSLRDRLMPDDLIGEERIMTTWYDKDSIKAWKENMPVPSDLMEFRSLPRRYKSNWRVLHVDGFEAGRLIFFDLKSFGFTVPAGATVTGVTAKLGTEKQD